MRLEAFLLNESRSKAISQDDMIKLISTKYSDSFEAAKNGILMYRGLRTSSSLTLLVKPSTSETDRRSANTSNHYTLLMDNLPCWKDYPKRSKSLICTTSIGTATGYGRVFVVLPANEAKIAVCPTYEIWRSFIPKIRRMDDFNDLFMRLGIDDTSWNGFVSDVKYQIDKALKKNDYNVLTLLEITGFFEDDVIKIREMGLINFLNEYLDPKKYNFKLEKMSSNISIPKRREIWTDSDCILIDVKSGIMNDLTF